MPLYGKDFGKLAVQIFFCLSGFLICQSLRRNRDWGMFFSARLLRIFPNLLVALILTSAVTLIWYSNYSYLWLHVGYVVHNSLMFFYGVQFRIPGVFSDANGMVVNGSLWSLPTELWLYVSLFLLFSLGRRRSDILIILCAVYLSVVWGAVHIVGFRSSVGNLSDQIVAHPYSEAGLLMGLMVPLKIIAHFLPLGVHQFSRLGSFFMSGAVLAIFWSYIEKYAIILGLAAVVVLPFVRHAIPSDAIVQAMALAMAVIGLGSSKAMAWFSKGGDASYGMYIFAWPIQQFSLLWFGAFWVSMIAAFLVTVGIGYATWHIFEKRAMSYRHRFAEALHAAGGSAISTLGAFRPRARG